MSPFRALTCSAMAALLVPGCSTPRDPEPALPDGCYYFIQDDIARELRLPWGIRLLQDSLEGWPAMATHQGVRLAATLHPDGDRDHPFGYWRSLPGDSIQVGYPAGGGMVLHLDARGDTLAGSAREVGDAMPLNADPPRGPLAVTLTRARCPEDVE